MDFYWIHADFINLSKALSEKQNPKTRNSKKLQKPETLRLNLFSLFWCLQICHGATFVRVDKTTNPKDGSSMLLFQGSFANKNLDSFSLFLKPDISDTSN